MVRMGKKMEEAIKRYYEIHIFYTVDNGRFLKRKTFSTACEWYSLEEALAGGISKFWGQGNIKAFKNLHCDIKIRRLEIILG